MNVELATYHFGEGQAGNARLGQGWSAPELGFVWSVGSASVIELPIPRGSPALALELTLAPYVQRPNLPHRWVSVHVNGRQAAEQRLGGEIVWWVPCPTGDAADLTVEIRLRETADFPGADARGLGVRLSRMMLFQVGAGSAVTTRPHRTTLRFGWNEQTESLLGKGWGEPEDGFVWALGGRSVLNLPVPVDDAPRTAIFDMRPRTTTERPQLRLLVQEGGQEAAHLTLPDRLAVAIDLRPAPGRSTIE